MILTRRKFIFILVFTTLMMATWVAETCRWLLYNNAYTQKGK
jgi:hypothetical protein